MGPEAPTFQLSSNQWHQDFEKCDSVWQNSSRMKKSCSNLTRSTLRRNHVPGWSRRPEYDVFLFLVKYLVTWNTVSGERKVRYRYRVIYFIFNSSYMTLTLWEGGGMRVVFLFPAPSHVRSETCTTVFWTRVLSQHKEWRIRTVIYRLKTKTKE